MKAVKAVEAVKAVYVAVLSPSLMVFLHLFLRLCPCLLHLQWSPQPLFDIRPLPLILFRLERFQSKIQILLRTNPPFTATTTALQTSCILRAWCLSFCKTPWKCTIQGKEGPLTLFCPLESISPAFFPSPPSKGKHDNKTMLPEQAKQNNLPWSKYIGSILLRSLMSCLVGPLGGSDYPTGGASWSSTIFHNYPTDNVKSVQIILAV